MPFPVGAAIMGGSALLGTGFNAFFQNKANNIAQKQFRESMNMQKYQYEDMKRYNSPENQVSMMRRAGINPALAYYGGSSPSTVSATSAPSSTAQVKPINTDSFISAFQGLQGDLNNTSALESQIQANQAAASKANAEAFGQNLRNNWLNKDMESIIKNRDLDSWMKENSIDLIKANAKLAQTELEFQQKSLGNRLSQQEWQSELFRAQAGAQLITNAYLPEQLRANIQKIIEEQVLAYKSGVATLQQASAAVMHAANEKHAFDAQFGGSQMQRNGFFRATMKLLSEKVNTEFSNQYKNWLSGFTMFGAPTAPGLYQGGQVINRTKRFNHDKDY